MSDRIHDIYRPAAERLKDFAEVEKTLPVDLLREQASRCLGCGVPFCHGLGCPLDNVIPEINTAVANGDWLTAWNILSSTSFFPEFTSRICPALCEGSCTEGLDHEAVMVRQLEKSVVDTAFRNGWVTPLKPFKRNSLKVAVIGGGPAGLSAATALNYEGYSVTLYERNSYVGGLLRYGIPDFKLNKEIIERRKNIMEEAGIRFVTNTEVGVDVSSEYLSRRYDAVVIAVGTQVARDLPVKGRELDGVHFALEFLQGQNRLNSGEISELPVVATGKNVVVIGGGDTGSDCVGTSLRQGAKSVLQVEIMPKPPESRSESTPWPDWPYLLRTSSSHKEGGEREWDITTKEIIGKDGHVTALEVAKVEWEFSPFGKPLKFNEVANSNRTIEADLVLLAMGFTGVPAEGIAQELELTLDRGRLQSAPERGIFVVGDARNGASLVVRAIADAKKVVADVNSYCEGQEK